MIPEGSFALPGARRHDGSDRSCDVLHIDLFLRPDLAARTLAGVATLTVAAIDTPLTRLELDAVDFEVFVVSDAAGQLEFVQRDATLAIELRVPLDVGERATIAVTYEVVRPRSGLYFAGAVDGRTDEALQCWTHGHAGGARHWFPCVDRMHQRQSSSMTIEVDAGLFALGNGELAERWENASTATTFYRYVQARPHASYLFTMVVGRFAEFAQASGALPVIAYVRADREADAVRTFGRTPAMIEAFERFTGVPYPYARYSQIAVAAFPFIGMENTTASTFTDEWLLDARTQATPAVESLVAHELAHQWFGNLVATREWTDVWLNEGFATYCEAVWDEARSGWDAYAYTIFRQVRTYVSEARQKYTRPIYCAHFRDPIDLFDKHLYEKAGAVLHMLRGTLGEARFARAINRYVHENAGREVETIDFIRAIEATSGRNMRAFFDRWIKRSGHPIVTVTFEYDPVRAIAQVRLVQRQMIDDTHLPYRFGIVVGFVERLPEQLRGNVGSAALDGERRITVDVNAAVTVFTISLDRVPALVRIDPGAWTLGEFAFDLGTGLACATLAYDPEPVARIRAAAQLAQDSSTRARDALTAAIASDPFWGARVEYAGILGEVRADWACRALLATLSDDDPNVRRAVCTALGNYRNGEVVAALRTLINSEPAADVTSEALYALGKSSDPQVVDDLVRALGDRSWCDVIGTGALLGLAEFGDQRAEGIVHEALRSDRPDRRQSALHALVTLAERRPLARMAYVSYCFEALDDPDAMTRLRAVHTLDEIGDTVAVEPLERMAKKEPIAWVRSHADRAAQRLQSAAPAPQRLQQVATDLVALSVQQARLNERVQILER